MGEGRNVCRVLVGKTEGSGPLERPRRRWQDGIKMDLREIGWGGVCSGFTWLRIGIVGGLLWVRWWTFGFWGQEVSCLCFRFQYLAMLFSSKTTTLSLQTKHKAFPFVEPHFSSKILHSGSTSRCLDKNRI
jgi:hypothetical protein